LCVHVFLRSASRTDGCHQSEGSNEHQLSHGGLLGNLLAAVGFFSKISGASFFAILGSLDATIVADLVAETFAPMDVLFYAIAVFEAFKLSFERVPRPG
jgi:hypothetical protein